MHLKMFSDLKSQSRKQEQENNWETCCQRKIQEKALKMYFEQNLCLSYFHP